MHKGLQFLIHLIKDKIMKKHHLIVSILALFIIVGSLFFIEPKVKASSSASQLSGWAWSDTIGWISMNCVDGGPTANDICSNHPYGVNYDTNTGDVSGYAWSDHVGWIKFGGLSGWPTNGGTSPSNSQINQSGKMLGWAKVLSMENPNDHESPGEGADGWISLYSNGSDHSTPWPYGVAFDLQSGASIQPSFAWGGVVTGWIDFSGVSITASTLLTDKDSAVTLQVIDQANATNTSTSTAMVQALNQQMPPNANNPVSTTLNATGSNITLAWAGQNVDMSTCKGTNNGASSVWNWHPTTYTAGTIIPLALGGYASASPVSDTVLAPTIYSVKCTSTLNGADVIANVLVNPKANTSALATYADSCKVSRTGGYIAALHWSSNNTFNTCSLITNSTGTSTTVPVPNPNTSISVLLPTNPTTFSLSCTDSNNIVTNATPNPLSVAQCPPPKPSVSLQGSCIGPKDTTVPLSWSSTGMTSCVMIDVSTAYPNLPTSGNGVPFAYNSNSNFSIKCYDSSGVSYGATPFPAIQVSSNCVKPLPITKPPHFKES